MRVKWLWKTALFLFLAGGLFFGAGLRAQEKTGSGSFTSKVLSDFEGEPAVELARFNMPESCTGKLEIVPGRSGKSGLKITFLPNEKSSSRYVDFLINKEPNLNPKNWVKEKYTTITFWVKGDGSKNGVGLFCSMGYDQEAKRWKTEMLASFSLENTDWQLITIPLGDKYELLKLVDGLYFYTGKSDQSLKGFSYTIDKFAGASY